MNELMEKAAVVISAELTRREHKKSMEEAASEAVKFATDLPPGYYVSKRHPGLMLEIFARTNGTGYLIHTLTEGE